MINLLEIAIDRYLETQDRRFAVALEQSLANWEHIKANWKYHFMKCVKPNRKLRRRNK